MEKLVFSTHNPHKIKEIKPLLPTKIQILSLRDIGWEEEIQETGVSFGENALIKAERVFKHTALPCFADDSGLEVKALQDAPGIYSARYAPSGKSQDNIQKLLSALEGVSDRTARLICVICLKIGEETHFFEGVLAGQIARRPQGAHGFGYDPVFIPQGYKKTLAQLPTEEKNRISHRAEALKKCCAFIKNRKDSR